MRKIQFLAGLLFMTGFAMTVNSTEIKDKDGFSFTIPDGWVQIPQKVIDQVMTQYRKMSPQFKTLKYNYAFQRANQKGWFVYPYIVVQIRKTGKIPEKYLNNFRKVEKDIQKGADKAQKGMQNKVSGTMKNTVYDKMNSILWSEMDANVKGVGKIKGLTAMKLTRFGTIQFVISASDKDYPKCEKEFRRMVWKMKVDPKIKYKP